MRGLVGALVLLAGCVASDATTPAGDPAGSFGSWDVTRSGYGDNTVVPVPADYDGDGKADLSIKDSNGVWYISFYHVTSVAG